MSERIQGEQGTSGGGRAGDGSQTSKVGPVDVAGTSRPASVGNRPEGTGVVRAGDPENLDF